MMSAVFPGILIWDWLCCSVVLISMSKGRLELEICIRGNNSTGVIAGERAMGEAVNTKRPDYSNNADQILQTERGYNITGDLTCTGGRRHTTCCGSGLKVGEQVFQIISGHVR